MISRRQFLISSISLPALIACSDGNGGCSLERRTAIDKLVLFAKEHIRTIPDDHAKAVQPALIPFQDALLAKVESEKASSDVEIAAIIAEMISENSEKQAFFFVEGTMITSTELLLMQIASGAITQEQLESSCSTSPEASLQ